MTLRELALYNRAYEPDGWLSALIKGLDEVRCGLADLAILHPDDYNVRAGLPVVRHACAISKLDATQASVTTQIRGLRKEAHFVPPEYRFMLHTHMSRIGAEIGQEIGPVSPKTHMAIFNPHRLPTLTEVESDDYSWHFMIHMQFGVYERAWPHV